MKNIKVWLPITLIGIFFLSVILFQDDLMRFLLRQEAKHTPQTVMNETEQEIENRYNYSKNNKAYKYTFLEFGSTHCSSCKQMEKVMDEIEQVYASIVNVVFINVTKPENKQLTKYFEIAEIPTQVLLDENGKEYFRHSGYITTKDLSSKFK